MVAGLDRLHTRLVSASSRPAGGLAGWLRFRVAHSRHRSRAPVVIGAITTALLLHGCNGAEARRAAGGAARVTDSILIARADSMARARQDSVNRAQPGYIVDSILPIEEELRRFRGDLKSAPTRFEGGAESRDALVARFVRAIASSDTSALRRMVMSRTEFAYLFYPSSPYTKPPYRQAPGLNWMLLERESSAGLTRLLSRLGGQQLRLSDYDCPAPAEQQDANVLWPKCVVRVTTPNGEVVRGRLFGTIIERDGWWKFMSFANDF